MSHHLVEAQQLQFSYPDGTLALEEVSFRITHGESVGIIGANGAGKSTLLLQMSGVLFPTGGALRIGDWPLTKKTLSRIRRTVGLIFQNPDDQLFMPTVYEDVAFGPLQQGYPAEEVELLVDRALEQVGIVHLKNRPPYKLSGGEKRMAAIAAVLAMTPDILVLDEPSAALDPMARRRLINLLATFRHTKIIASHDLDLVLDLCERTIIMNRGRIVADGPTGELLRNEALLREAHLEKPLRLQGCPVCNRDNPGGS